MIATLALVFGASCLIAAVLLQVGPEFKFNGKVISNRWGKIGVALWMGVLILFFLVPALILDKPLKALGRRGFVEYYPNGKFAVEFGPIKALQEAK